MQKVDLFGVLEPISACGYFGIAQGFLGPKALIKKTVLESRKDAKE